MISYTKSCNTIISDVDRQPLNTAITYRRSGLTTYQRESFRINTNSYVEISQPKLLPEVNRQKHVRLRSQYGQIVGMLQYNHPACFDLVRRSLCLQLAIKVCS